MQICLSTLPRRSSYRKLLRNGSDPLPIGLMWILTFLLSVFHTIQLVDPRSVVCRISSERNLEGRQELVHSRQQGLWSKVCLNTRWFWDRAPKTYGAAVAATAGRPSNTITRSARYVAMIKSCSMTNAVFLAWRIYLHGMDF